MPKRQARTKDKKFEDLRDPERCRAQDFGFTMPIEENGKVVGHSHSWLLTDRDESINIIEFADGSVSCYIESFNDE